MDESGSMGDGTRMSSAKKAANNFVDTLLTSNNTTTRIAVVSFESVVQTNIGLTNDKDALKTAINGLEPDGGTFTQSGIKQAKEILKNSDADYKNIVLLSDGLPTYSYGIYNPLFHLTGDETGTNIQETDFNYNQTVGTGTGMRSRIYVGVIPTDFYYNHGNSTIAESGFAKNIGNLVYTIGLETDEDGSSVLNSVASPGKAYTGSADDLQEIFSIIAGEIAAAVRNASVIDNMGLGFEVSKPNEITVSQGTANYDETNKRINWNIGNLTEPISAGSDIKFAEMTYRVEINDDILNAPNENGLYNTNGETSISYIDANGEQKTKEFESPKVDPILLIIEKILVDSDGNKIEDENKIFKIKVTSTKGYDEVYDLKSSERKILTNLRLEDNYTVSEINSDDYYTTININEENTNKFQVNQEDPDINILVTNKYNLTNVEGIKSWNDGGNQDGKRPERIVVELHKIVDGKTELVDTVEVTPNEEGDWKYSFTKLPKFEDKVLIKYSVKEQVVEDYTSEVTDYDIENSYTPEETELTVIKNWEDGRDQDGKRPESIKVELYADGKLEDTQTLDETNNWTYKWTGLDKYKAGEEIKYTVKEKDIPVDYETNQKTNLETRTVTITNSYTPEETEVEGIKSWNDGGNQDGKRPEKIVVELHKTVNGKTELVDTVEVTPNEEGDWKYSFTKLPKFEDKVLIKYSVKEQAVEDYTSEVTDYDIENSYTPEETELEVVKSWNDGGDQDKIRPNKIEVELYARQKGTREEGKLVDTQTLNKDNNWTYKWSKLDRYKDKVELEYYVAEKDVPKGYTVSYTVNKDTKTITITNSHTSAPTTPDKPKLPKSGTVATWGFAIVGIGLVALGAYQFRKKKQD